MLVQTNSLNTYDSQTSLLPEVHGQNIEIGVVIAPLHTPVYLNHKKTLRYLGKVPLKLLISRETLNAKTIIDTFCK
jgi:hypothetical protein